MNKKQYERRMYFLLHSLNQTINQMVETNDDYYKDNELNAKKFLIKNGNPFSEIIQDKEF